MKSEEISMSPQPELVGGVTQPVAEEWTTIIRPTHPWFQLDLKDLWRYRDLVRLFVHRDFVAQYKQTILGPLWFFLQPLFTTIVFTVIFGRIAKIPTDGIPDFLFYLSGTVCWGYFSGCLMQNSETFISNSALFGKVYFPRLVVPLSIVLSHIFKFLIQFGLFLSFLVYFQGVSPLVQLRVLVLPVLIMQMALLGIGCGILISSMTTKYRDLTYVASFGVQLWMFATPVVYPLSQIPEAYRQYFLLNPMSAIVESFRAAFLGTSFPEAAAVALSWTITLAVLFGGLVIFHQVEKTFMDTI